MVAYADPTGLGLELQAELVPDESLCQGQWRARGGVRDKDPLEARLRLRLRREGMGMVHVLLALLLLLLLRIADNLPQVQTLQVLLRIWSSHLHLLPDPHG